MFPDWESLSNPTAPAAPAPYARKPSIVDRVLGRLFPTAQYTGLLDPEQQHGLQRQGLLNVGLNLLQAGGPQAMQRGTLANIGSSIQGVNFPELAQHAIQVDAYRRQLGQQQAVSDAVARHPAKAGEDRQGAYDRLSAIAVEVAGISPELAAKFAPILDALKTNRTTERREPLRIEGTNTKLGTPFVGREGTLLIDPDTHEQIGFYPKGQTPKEPTPVERVAGSQLDSATQSVATMEDIAQRNPAAAKAAVAAVRAGGWGKLGTIFSEARGYASDPDAQNFYTEFNNALLSFSPIYGGTRTTQQILQLEKAAVLPALGSGDFAAAFRHLHNRLHDLRAKAGKAAGPEPETDTMGNPFPVRNK